MGIPLLRGRLPGHADTERTEPVFIIDEELVRRFWPGEDPIGTRVAWGKAEGERLAGEIVGVVGRVRWGGIAANPQPTTYFWFPQDPRVDVRGIYLATEPAYRARVAILLTSSQSVR